MLQLEIELKARRGIVRAQHRAERECGEDWTQSAAEYLYDFSRTIAHWQPFLIEDARTACPLAKPTNAKAWGAAVRRAKSLGWIRESGFARTRCSNGSPRATWRAA